MQFSHDLASKVFIYALLCPLSNQIRYIGKSKNPRMRLRHHLKEVRKQDWKVSPNYRQAWIHGLLSQGLKPTLLILEEIDETEWQSKEIYWISYYKKLGLPLVNSTDGGDGGLNPSEETRQKQSYHKKGKRLSDTHRENMRKAQIARYQNAEELERARKVLAEIRQRDSVRQKRIATTTERWKDENFRQTTSAAISKSKQKYVYFIKTSDGNVEKVLNLKNWCQTNGYKLQSLQQVARGARSSCHGITIARHLLKVDPRKPEIAAAQTPDRSED